jgi:hypothetical protein
MDILHIEKKGQLMNAWEQFHIHKLSKHNLQMNGTYTDINKHIFDLTDSHYKRKINTNLPHLTPLPHLKRHPSPPPQL